MADRREAQIRNALRELERADRAAEHARQAFWQALASAHAEGLTLTAIGQLLGVSRQRVEQLVRKGRAG